MKFRWLHNLQRGYMVATGFRITPARSGEQLVGITWRRKRHVEMRIGGLRTSKDEKATCVFVHYAFLVGAERFNLLRGTARSKLKKGPGPLSAKQPRGPASRAASAVRRRRKGDGGMARSSPAPAKRRACFRAAAAAARAICRTIAPAASSSPSARSCRRTA